MYIYVYIHTRHRDPSSHLVLRPLTASLQHAVSCIVNAIYPTKGYTLAMQQKVSSHTILSLLTTSISIIGSHRWGAWRSAGNQRSDPLVPFSSSSPSHCPSLECNSQNLLATTLQPILICQQISYIFIPYKSSHHFYLAKNYLAQEFHGQYLITVNFLANSI